MCSLCDSPQGVVEKCRLCLKDDPSLPVGGTRELLVRPMESVSGAIISLEQQWRLAKSWYTDRMELEWRRKTEQEIDALWQELGLTSLFWDLHS